MTGNAKKWVIWPRMFVCALSRSIRKSVQIIVAS